MVVDIDNYDLLLKLDFFIKIKVVDVEKKTIHVKHVLPLYMVKMLQVVKDKVHPS